MKILAYTDKRYLKATLEVVGEEADLLISPPLRAADIYPVMLEGYDLIYIDLHGVEEGGFLYSGIEGERIPALGVEVVREAELKGTIVFAISCFLPKTSIARAFKEAGAYLIAGEGENYGSRESISGAQRLAKAFIELKVTNPMMSLDETFDKAKMHLRGSLAKLIDGKAIKDALDFKIL